MSPSSLLEDFDPFATHPFTNTSGLMAPPPPPSQYPIPIPLPRKQGNSLYDGFYPASSRSEDLSISPSPSSIPMSASTSSDSPSSIQSSPPLHSPQAIPWTAMSAPLATSPNPVSLGPSITHKRSQGNTAPLKSAKRPIFVPFRQDAASPDLVLKKRGQQRSTGENSSTAKKS